MLTVHENWSDVVSQDELARNPAPQSERIVQRKNYSDLRSDVVNLEVACLSIEYCASIARSFQVVSTPPISPAIRLGLEQIGHVSVQPDGVLYVPHLQPHNDSEEHETRRLPILKHRLPIQDRSLPVSTQPWFSGATYRSSSPP